MRLAPIFILILTIVTYFAANALSVPIMDLLAGQSCVNAGWFVECHQELDTSANPLANLALAAIALLSMLGLRAFARQTSIYPFGILICTVTLFAIGLDAIVQRGILNHDRLVNDTMNALSIVILGSFVVVTSIASFRQLPVLRLGAAVLWSFAVKIAGMVVFAFLEQSFRGPVELWLLYGVFMWMVFGLHLMSISIALVDIDNRSLEAGALA